VAVLGLIGGSVLDIYSSGLAMLTLGVRIPRYAAALIDGTVMTLGSIYVVFVAHNFIAQSEGFLITLGVPIAASCGVMLADVALRRRDYAEPELLSPAGRYGDIRWAPVAAVVVATGIGWGLVTNTNASWLTWQGYPARPVRPGRQDRSLGVRQPGRPGGAGHRLRRAPGVRPGGRPGRPSE
jgi:NCS1 family nucleobase:cation symporter-1